MDALARYYTEDIVSNILIQNISYNDPQIIIDFGVGDGALTKTAYKKWTSANFFATDIDTQQLIRTSKKLKNINFINVNSLNKSIERKLKLILGTVDVAICNPPYLKITSKQPKYLKLLDKVGLGNCKELKYLTSDLIFLAQNLLFLKEGGELGIILPDGLISSKEFELLRKDLIENHSVLSIIQLPDRIFKKTEAKTHILILKKGKTDQKEIAKLLLIDKSGNYIDNLNVPLNSLTERMDFFYHKENLLSNNNLDKILTLREIGAEIKRGQLTHSQLKDISNNYIHTTTLIDKTDISLIDDISKEYLNFLSTKSNDILLARVGRGCIGKVSFVNKGSQLISDCVYRVRVPEKYLKIVWTSFCSIEGQLWLKSRSKGVCARTLSKEDLLNFPVISIDNLIL